MIFSSTDMEKEKIVFAALVLVAVVVITFLPSSDKISSPSLQIRSNSARDHKQRKTCNGTSHWVLQNEKKLKKFRSSRRWKDQVQTMVSLLKTLVLFEENQLNISRDGKVMCIYAGIGHEVMAFRMLGFNDSIGIDAVESPPLVIKGDAHHHPFADNTFDLEFSAHLSDSLIPEIFVAEIERTLRPGGLSLVLTSFSSRHVSGFFKSSDVVRVQNLTFVGLPSNQILLRKNT